MESIQQIDTPPTGYKSWQPLVHHWQLWTHYHCRCQQSCGHLLLDPMQGCSEEITALHLSQIFLYKRSSRQSCMWLCSVHSGPTGNPSSVFFVSLSQCWNCAYTIYSQLHPRELIIDCWINTWLKWITTKTSLIKVSNSSKKHSSIAGSWLKV